MEKKLKRNRDYHPEFWIHKDKFLSKEQRLMRQLFPFYGDYSICINSKDFYFTLELTRLEWNSLFKFLRHTKSKKYLPKDADAYKGIIFSKKVSFWYYSSKDLIDTFKKEKDFDRDPFLKGKSEQYVEHFKKLNIARIEKEAKAAKKYLITDKVFFSKGISFFCIGREKFFRFREHCLDSKNVVID